MTALGTDRLRAIDIVCGGEADSPKRFLRSPVLTPTGHSKHSLDLLIGLSHRLGDGDVVSFLYCIKDPPPEGHMASHIERRKFSHARRCGGCWAARGAGAAGGDAGDRVSPQWNDF
jgi:hypothetical protein